MTIHPGDTGTDVRRVQLLLDSNRYGIDFYTGTLDGEFGPLTGLAVREAKRRLGYPTHLITDPVGDQFISYLLRKVDGGKRRPASFILRAKARAATVKVLSRRQQRLKLAKKHLGYIEGSGNHTVYGKWYGLDGNPWCAMFVSYIDHQAGGNFRYAYTPFITRDARAGTNGLRETSDPSGGDIVTFDFDNSARDSSAYATDHVGFFDRWVDRARGIFTTVEGNTGDASQSDGGGVRAKTRYTTQVEAFVQTPKVAA